MLKALHEALAKMDIRMRLAQPRAGVRDVLRAEGLEKLFGDFGRRINVADVIEELQSSGASPAPATT